MQTKRQLLLSHWMIQQRYAISRNEGYSWARMLRGGPMKEGPFEVDFEG